MRKTDAERQAAYAKRRRAKGMRLVGVWVPERCAQDLKDYARKLNERNPPKPGDASDCA